MSACLNVPNRFERSVWIEFTRKYLPDNKYILKIDAHTLNVEILSKFIFDNFQFSLKLLYTITFKRGYYNNRLLYVYRRIRRYR